VPDGIERFVELTSVDEVMVCSATFDHGERLRSCEILAAVLGRSD
jgi:hypothetical protein